MLRYLSLSLLFFTSLISENRFCILIPSYNNEAYVRWNLESALSQTYENFYIIFIDDASTDQTLKKAKGLIDAENGETIVFLENSSRKGALANQYEAIHSYIEDDDIVVFLDGDDALAHPNVLEHLNHYYTDPNLWLTYGQFSQHPGGEIGYAYPYPDEVIRNHTFRSFVHGPTHLRTCRSWLFKKIQYDDLLYQGEFIPICTNLATMLPMIEMAANGHFMYIDEVLYLYNSENPLSHHRYAPEYQGEIARYIRSKLPYPAL